MTIDDLNKMRLHETWQIDANFYGNLFIVTCVPGGWIYSFLTVDNFLNVEGKATVAVFVPRHYTITGVDKNE